MEKPVYVLEFEKPLRELTKELDSLHQKSLENNLDLSTEVRAMEKLIEQAQRDIYSNLTPWQRVQIARHPKRPYALDYVGMICEGFQELHGDRQFRDDRALIGGTAFFNGEAVMIIAQQKGRDTKENILRNFGMPQPEGYRKALRLLKTAERFQLPVLTFIDTPGAYPGIGAEERGQAEAIAVNLEVMSSLGVPSISIVIGEGGSGGALALGVTNKIMMLEYSTYSVISPESCSSILYRDATKAQKSAENLKLTAKDLAGFGIVDEVIKEAPGGAHRDPKLTAENLAGAIRRQLNDLRQLSPEQLVRQRYQKFRAMGVFTSEE